MINSRVCLTELAGLPDSPKRQKRIKKCVVLTSTSEPPDPVPMGPKAVTITIKFFLSIFAEKYKDGGLPCFIKVFLMLPHFSGRPNFRDFRDFRDYLTNNFYVKLVPSISLDNTARFEFLSEFAGRRFIIKSSVNSKSR